MSVGNSSIWFFNTIFTFLRLHTQCLSPTYILHNAIHHFGFFSQTNNKLQYIYLIFVCVIPSLTYSLCPPLKTFNFSQQG